MRRPPLARRHLDARVLLEYLDESLGTAERRRVEEHLAGPCARCRGLLEEIARVAGAMASDRVPPVPRALRERAWEAYQPGTAPAAPVPTAWQLARLVFDSLSDPLPAGVRRSVGDARWLRWSLSDHELEIEAEPEAGGAWTLRGRLTGPDPPLFRLDVETGGERRMLWPDAAGRFTIERVPSGDAAITLRGPSGRHRLPSITL